MENRQKYQCDNYVPEVCNRDAPGCRHIGIHLYRPEAICRMTGACSIIEDGIDTKCSPISELEIAICREVAKND